MGSKRAIFKGVFKTQEEAAESIGVAIGSESFEKFSETYSSSRWLERQENMLRLAREGNVPRPSSLLDQDLLHAPSEILDIGGGSGWLFECLKKSYGGRNIQNYTVLEIPVICEHFTNHFLPTEPIRFISKIDEVEQSRFEVMYFNSSLQYLSDLDLLEFKGLRNKPNYVVIDDLPLTEESTFYSNQLYYGSYINIRFINRTDLNSVLEGSGYELISENQFITIISDAYAWAIELKSGEVLPAPSTYTRIYRLVRQEGANNGII